MLFRSVEYFGVSTSNYIQIPKQITIQVEAVFDGFMAPLNKGVATIRSKSTLPVKFRLLDFNGMPFQNAQAWLDVSRLTAGEPEGWMPASSTSMITGENAFRNAGNGQYLFNLSTKDLEPGMYRLRVTLNDGNQYMVDLNIR